MLAAAMASFSDVVLDLWSPLSHKAPLRTDALGTNLAPSWVPEEERRRLNAYRVLSAYLSNVARHMLPSSSTEDELDYRERREYGDPDLIVDRIIAGVLGDTPQIVVAGADGDLGDAPRLPRKPAEPEAGDGPERAAYEAALRVWETRAVEAIDRWETGANEQPRKRERQEWLREWADAEGLIPKLLEAERDCVGLGDQILACTWSSARQRMKVDVYDPGFYFPDLESMGRSDDFPERVFIAWEYEVETDGKRVRWVRRLSYELGPIAPLVDDAGAAIDPVGATLTADGWVRTYPWNDEPSSVTCYLTDAAWPLTTLNGKAVAGFPESEAVYAVNEDGEPIRRLDLRIDFLPVVHIPNTPATKEHYGRSALAIIAQILDDLSATDTDVQSAAALAAGPAIALSGARAEDLIVAPGKVFNLGPDGQMTALDLSAGLAELRNVLGDLLERLSVNGRVPAEMLGRVKASEVPSGIALSLAFGPFGQVVNSLRLVRAPRWALLLKMAQRFALANGVIQGPILPAEIVPGSYLASDTAGTVSVVVSLLQAHGISRRTALRLLVGNGIEIGDLADELAAIEREDVEGAVKVADATGSEDLARERLGYGPAPVDNTPAPTIVPPTVNLPPVPGAPSPADQNPPAVP